MTEAVVFYIYLTFIKIKKSSRIFREGDFKLNKISIKVKHLGRLNIEFYTLVDVEIIYERDENRVLLIDVEL